ncbi:MAG: hypothetical protein ACLGIM_20530, partial [Alphaproteobacteria bacterium]
LAFCCGLCPIYVSWYIDCQRPPFSGKIWRKPDILQLFTSAAKNGMRAAIHCPAFAMGMTWPPTIRIQPIRLTAAQRNIAPIFPKDRAMTSNSG